MKLFNIFKKRTAIPTQFESELESFENYPEMLTVKLLFKEKPELRGEKILRELKKYYDNVENPIDNKALIFSFSDFQIEMADVQIPAQCLIAIPDGSYPEIKIPETAFQQNWHWNEANELAKECRYELLVTDFMTRTLEYKKRLNLYTDFLFSVTKATAPDVIYSVCGQKLIKPADLIDICNKPEKQLLYSVSNVRFFKLGEANKQEFMMDTIGLNSIGLPDFQILFFDQEPNEIAKLLWNYAYYIYDYGDIIKDGNTLEGISSGSKWKCNRQFSLLDPVRAVINVQPN